MSILTGLGYDIHRLEDGDHLLLAGVKVPADKRIVAHSDGDIVYHCLAQAIFSALGSDDIGSHFPDSSAETSGLSSSLIVKKALEEMRNSGYQVNNVVVAIILEKPKLKQYKMMIKEEIAKILDIKIDRVAVHANTSEMVGPVGEGSAIACLCNILLKKD